MQPPTKKLKLRHETIRALDARDLRRAAGGDGAAVQGESNAAMCTTLSLLIGPAGK